MKNLLPKCQQSCLRSFVRLINLAILGSLLMSCQITTQRFEALSVWHWEMPDNTTASGKLVWQKLQEYNNPKGKTTSVSLTNEKFNKRTISVNSSGQPSEYIQELSISLKVYQKDKLILNESVFTARTLDQNAQTGTVEESQKQPMIENLSRLILIRLNELVAFADVINNPLKPQELNPQPSTNTQSLTK